MENAERIVRKEIEIFTRQLSERKITAEFTGRCVTFIAEKGFSREFGARNISRVFRELVKDLFIDKVLFGELESGGHVVIDSDGNSVSIKMPVS